MDELFVLSVTQLLRLLGDDGPAVATDDRFCIDEGEAALSDNDEEAEEDEDEEEDSTVLLEQQNAARKLSQQDGVLDADEGGGGLADRLGVTSVPAPVLFALPAAEGPLRRCGGKGRPSWLRSRLAVRSPPLPRLVPNTPSSASALCKCCFCCIHHEKHHEILT